MQEIYSINSCIVFIYPSKFHMSSHTTSDHFTRICNEIMNLNKSIRFVGVVNNLGTLLVTTVQREVNTTHDK